MEDSSLAKAKELQVRTREFALRIIRMFQGLPKSDEARILGRQVLRSGISVGATTALSVAHDPRRGLPQNSVWLWRRRTRRSLWLEILVKAEIVPAEKMQSLINEADELLRIFAAAKRTARKNTVIK